MLKEKVEEFFGCEYQLFIEFTGLISWTKGASIGWHSDDNRPYLKQRDFAVVCYLNTHGKDFKGGLFHFQDGEPSTIVPMAGDVVMYTADSQNIHSVDEITEGERLTLTLWFSRDSYHDEDVKLISLLSQNFLNSKEVELGWYLPLPASSDMYWFSPDTGSRHKSGFDISCARAHILGFTFYSSDDKIGSSSSDSSHDLSELLMKPLCLGREEELLEKEFDNSLHALQVLQFYSWKASEYQEATVGRGSGNVVSLSQLQLKKNNSLKPIPLGDIQIARTVFGSVSCDEARQSSFHWAGFTAALEAWESYSRKLRQELLMSLPFWRTHQSIFSVPLMDLESDTCT
ncbi:PREDICTED: uncharacterized protein LOC104607266 isoform X2 [Nelumbo nucifera]|nr:PREDICTED: uncharacterized protein LOC104607266 isoform X2 [Nelumbo nucifera]